jgi:hypothetical protein
VNKTIIIAVAAGVAVWYFFLRSGNPGAESTQTNSSGNPVPSTYASGGSGFSFN